jgi:hypothetical protein
VTIQSLTACATVLGIAASTVIVGQLVGRNTAPKTASEGVTRPLLGLPYPSQIGDTDFKRHDLGPNFYERNYNGTLRTHFMTTPLWGVGSTSPSGHDGRSISLTEVILRHDGEARVRERVCEQHDGKRELRPGVPVIHDNTLAAVNASYPILLVPAVDSKVPPPTGGVALVTGRDLRSNLVAPQVLEPLLSRMWKQSRTFRRQCARIDAAPGLLVRVLTAATVSQSGGRAATDIRRGAAGLEAVVYIARPAAASDLIELIAHEFEHIIEQLDGLDLARLARLAPVTVWATDGQRFETERATHRGRLVAAEVEGRAR